MILIRVLLVFLVLRNATSVPCLSNESKKDLDESRKDLKDTKKHIEKTINTLENGFKKQIGIMKKALNTIGGKILKLDKDFKALGKDFAKSKWHKYNGHCYYYSPDNDKQDWFTSERKCREIGGYIVKIDNKKELKSITENRPNQGMSYWIGLTDVEEGKFRWSFDQTKLTLSNWYPGYGKANTNYNCVLLHSGRTDWFDYPCEATKATYICESNFCF